MTRYTKFKKTFNSSAVSTAGNNTNETASRVQKYSKYSKIESGTGYASVNKALNCLKCRKPGHKMRDCPENKTAPEYCYNCGEAEHSTKQCPIPFSNYAHALCFLCDTKGHLASACPKNDRGVYPNGGCCHYCGSIKHLARNCRPTQSSTNGNEIIITASMTSGTNPEIDDVHEALQKIQHNRLHGRQQQTESGENGNEEGSEEKKQAPQIKKKKKSAIQWPPGDLQMRHSIAIIADNPKEFDSFNDIKEFSLNRDSCKIILIKNVGKKAKNHKFGKIFMIPFVTKAELIYFEVDDQIAIFKSSSDLFSIISTEIIKVSNKEHISYGFLNEEPIEIESIYCEAPNSSESTIILPSCPVCIKRLDKSISGLNTIKCRDLFHSCCRDNCKAISKDCSVCGVINAPCSSNNCSDCSSTENLWICLICANLGCGRYKSGHAHNHFTRTNHAFALKLDSHHIWDYTSDKYVHWNIQSDGGTVVDVDEDLKSSEDVIESLRTQPKENFSNDLMTAQLESQKAYFDERVIAIKNEHKHEISKLKHEHDKIYIELKEQISKLNHERKIFSDLSSHLQEQMKKFKSQNEQLKNDLETERKISQGLSDSYDKLNLALTDSRAEKKDLEDQVKDLMKHIEILDLMGKAGNDPDIVEGKLLIRQSNAKKNF